MFRFRWIGPVVQWTIVAGIVVGAVSTFRSGRERNELRAEYRRLAAKVGELDVEDPEKVWLVALDTGDPMHFAWRVYLPANYRLKVRHPSGWGSSWGSDPKEFIARVRFRDEDDDAISVYKNFGSGSSRGRYAHGDAAAFVRKHREAFEIEQLGRDGPVSLDPDEPAELLRIRLPAELKEQAEAELPAHSASRLGYYLTLDPSDERD